MIWDSFIATANDSTLIPLLRSAVDGLRKTTEWLVQQDINERFAGAVAYQKAFARVLGGYFHLVAAMSGEGKRVRLATFYINSLLPESVALCAQAQTGAADLYAIGLNDFAV